MKIPNQLGPTPTAFDFKQAFDTQGSTIKIDRQRVRQKAGKLPEIDWRDRIGQSESPSSPD